MASDTVPAAVPGPGDPPSTPPATTPSPGGMAGLLAPVTPARFDLSPTDGTDTPAGAAGTGPGGDQVIAGASSADFHNGNTTASPGPQNGATRTDQTGVVRAWLLAGAERWRKGADARNKALDIKKARAQAYKEAVTTTVNRSEKMVGGSTSANTGSNTQAKTDKNTGTRTSTHSGSSGGRGSGSGSGGGRGSGGNSGTGSSRNDSSRHSNRDGRASGPGGGSNTGPGSARHDKNGRTDRASSGRGQSGTDRAGNTHNGSGGRGRAGADLTSSTGSSGRGSDTHSTSPGPRRKDRGGRAEGSDVTTQTCGDSSGIGKNPTRQNRNDKPDAQKNPETYKVVLDKDPKPARTDPKPAAKDSTPAPTTDASKDTKRTGPRTASGTPTGINTQGAREAGYRDGARVGQVIAQAGAYRDGAKDGLSDTREAAQQEKGRLDEARQRRKSGQAQPRLRPPLPEDETDGAPKTRQKQPPPEPDQPVANIPPMPKVPPRPTQPPTAGPSTPTPTSAAPAAQDPKDTTVPPTTTVQPVQVNRVGKNSIELGAGAARSTISHGEVRTLRAFQHRLKVKADGMTRVVEACAGLKSYAEQQLAKAIWWTEQARTVEGGEHLIGPLMKLEEAATIQVRKAEEIRKRAARAADSCRALIANVDIRYAPIYKAVCDSPHTKPAVLAYYREMANA